MESREVDESVTACFEIVRKLKARPDIAENDFVEEDFDYKVELSTLLRE